MHNMKYKVEDLREADTKDLDVTRFFPSAKEPVVITIRRLTTKKHNEAIALMTLGGELKTQITDGGIQEGAAASFVATNTAWYSAARMVEILGGVILNDKFPFETWDEPLVDILDKRNPEFIAFLQDEIRTFDRPLVQKPKKASGQ